jgi:alpha-glucosidase
MMLIPFILIRNSVVLKVTVIRDSLIRFRYTTKGYFSNDFLMRLIKIMHGYNFLEVTGEEDYYQIQTSKVKCVIQKQI